MILKIFNNPLLIPNLGDKMYAGKFIVFEGLDGAGTTTQAKELVSYLFDKGKHFVPILTREPTSHTVYGLEIRRRLKRELLPHEMEIHTFDYWANLFINDRKWHLDKVVVPNLKNGIQVISDRHMLSTLAYQSAQGGQMEQLAGLHDGFHTPDITFFLRVPVEVALERISRNRSGSPEYFEQKERLEQVAANYELAIALVGEKHKVVVIDGTFSKEEVSRQVQLHIDKLYSS